MKSSEISEVPASAPCVKPGCSEPLLLTDHGRLVATIVPAEEDDAESMLLSINPKLKAILERSRSRLETEGGLSSEKVRKQLEIAAIIPLANNRSRRRSKGTRGQGDRPIPAPIDAQFPSCLHRPNW
jgi:antitoxin (DNA-binding transcriptional repressor) of toxin-antitoxin stability system